MWKIRTSRQFALALLSWVIAAVVGITVAFMAVGFFHLWVLVGVFGAIGATLATGLVLQLALCTDVDAVLAAREAGAPTDAGAEETAEATDRAA
ncbi:hypothetical protein roselon_00190 [Roseibacterium elongatum DSM 19469]|uniref:Uncharacterized protein n=1 Tax=Roseicyclus elongatus DSM 19469 TaxID=1294273 RepID=W8RXU4_9RHOB|nr:hypothetical protein [Roseibacterium elongatum]AHM02647.1 hypothetical protein roselon_00190 [Roseibacterium elongatum DSM 19469]